MKWIKAIKELSPHMTKVCCRRTRKPDFWFTAHYEHEKGMYICPFGGMGDTRVDDIEWLDEFPKPIEQRIKELRQEIQELKTLKKIRDLANTAPQKRI